MWQTYHTSGAVPISVRRHMMRYVLLVIMLSSTTWLRWCLPGYSTVKLQFFLNNQEYLVQKYFETIQYCFPLYLYLLLLASIGNSFIVKTFVCLIVILFPSFFLHYLLQLYCKKELSLHPSYSTVQLYLWDSSIFILFCSCHTL